MSRRRGRRLVLPGRPRRRDAATSGRSTLPNAAPDNLWYRFIVTDGTDTDYYADDTAALDGGLGAPTDDAVDQSWALMRLRARLHGPGLGEGRGDLPDLPRPLPQRPQRTTTRRPATSATTTRSLKLPWGDHARGLLPQLRRRATPTARGASTRRRPTDSPTKEQPRGRDYYRRRPQGRRPAARLPRRRSASTRSTSTRSSTPARTTATTRRTTRRSTRTSARRRTSTTSSSTRRRAGSG